MNPIYGRVSFVGSITISVTWPSSSAPKICDQTSTLLTVDHFPPTPVILVQDSASSALLILSAMARERVFLALLAGCTGYWAGGIYYRQASDSSCGKDANVSWSERSAYTRMSGYVVCVYHLSPDSSEGK